MSTWSKLTVAVLREELASRKLDTKGKKAELVARLQAYDEREGEDRGDDVDGEDKEPKGRKEENRDRDLGVHDQGQTDPPPDDPSPPCTEQTSRKRRKSTVTDSIHHNAGPSSRKKNDSKNAGEAKGAVPPSSGEEDELETFADKNRQRSVGTSGSCPYLSTINRRHLDFDFEKCCSVSLSTMNVYVCLVCGKYFQGRGPSTHAYTHSLEMSHHLFMRLDSGRTFCLPDGYEVIDPSLSDIQFVLNPSYNKEDIARLDDPSCDNGMLWARDLAGKEFMPGLVGLNNMKANDYANVALQGLLRVSPVRDFFLRKENYADVSTPLLERFGELVRKTHNPRAFRGHVSPHDFMQSVISKSDKKFAIETQGDPVQFFTWLLNSLHMDLTRGDRKKSSVISDALQGEIEVTTIAGTGAARKSSTDLVQRLPFLMLTLDLPPAPLFKDAMEKIVIPQIPIFDLLKKFDGESIQDDVRLGRRKMRLVRLPQYLVISVKRFLKNQFFLEKNPTMVNFPAKGLELQAQQGNGTYDLVTNVVHEGGAKEVQGSFKAHIFRKSERRWYEVQDLRLNEILPRSWSSVKPPCLFTRGDRATRLSIT